MAQVYTENLLGRGPEKIIFLYSWFFFQLQNYIVDVFSEGDISSQDYVPQVCCCKCF